MGTESKGKTNKKNDERRKTIMLVCGSTRNKTIIYFLPTLLSSSSSRSSFFLSFTLQVHTVIICLAQGHALSFLHYPYLIASSQSYFFMHLPLLSDSFFFSLFGLFTLSASSLSLPFYTKQLVPTFLNFNHFDEIRLKHFLLWVYCVQLKA